MENERQCQVREKEHHFLILFLIHYFAFRIFAQPHLGVFTTHTIVTPVGAFSLKTVMHRVHARIVSVVNLDATQMKSQLPQLQRAMMRVSNKLRLLQGRVHNSISCHSEIPLHHWRLPKLSED